MSFFKFNVENLQTQKELYLQKLKNDFAVMYRMLDMKFVEIYAKIVKAFEECVDESEHMKSGFQAYLTRLHYIKSYNAQRDIDMLHVNQLSDDLLSLNISTKYLHDFDIASESTFINEPIAKFESLLNVYDFVDISERSLKIIRRKFLDSKILRPEYVVPEFHAMFGQLGSITKTDLLYRMNKDGCSPEIFHKRCDDQGATIILVNANNGYVFGAFNPTSWVNQYCYSECEEAFLFSLVEPTRKRRPFKCRVKPNKVDFAIKQSEAGFSPGFGEANNCDLFIAYKSPNRSYCKLGIVYEPPEEIAKGLTQ
jgi:hypothetical protein